MLHIILLILKIIGIVILSILGFLLFVLLVISFMPVIYRIQGTKHGEEMYGSGKIFWLFISAKASVNNKDKVANVKVLILGIPLEIYQKIGSVIGKACKGIAKLFSKRKKKDRPVKQVAKIEENKVVAPIKEETIAGIDKVVEAEATKEIKATIEKTQKEKVQREKKQEEKAQKEKEVHQEGFWNRIKTLLIKLYYFLQWLYRKVQKIYLTISELCGKIKQWKEFLTGETFKKALRFALDKGNTLRKHILPRKVKGSIIYGFDDPAITGQTLAVLSAITPLYKGKLKIVPMFNQEALEGDILMRGHVFGFVLIKIAWSVYRNKDVKEVIHHFSQKEA